MPDVRRSTLVTLMAQQPLLADRTKLESVMCPQAPRRQCNDGDEQEDRGSGGDGDGTDHGAIKIRSSETLRKLIEIRRDLFAVRKSCRRLRATRAWLPRRSCPRTTTSSHPGACSTRLRQAPARSQE